MKLIKKQRNRLKKFFTISLRNSEAKEPVSCICGFLLFVAFIMLLPLFPNHRFICHKICNPFMGMMMKWKILSPDTVIFGFGNQF
jgi:hypothetical protein